MHRTSTICYLPTHYSNLLLMPMAQLLPRTLLVLATLLLISCFQQSCFSLLNNATDRNSLLSFKSKLSGGSGGLWASWNETSHFCQWQGVICGGRRHPQRVISLNLSSLNLKGPISPTIANLTFLRELDLSNNQFHGPIPHQIGGLYRLQYLNLSLNHLEGGIPASISQCTQLQVISMRYNNLNGEIPQTISQCLGLGIIDLKSNNLTGSLPPSLGNLSSLSKLTMGINQLSGIIPPTLGKLSKLTILSVNYNYLTGGIPSTIWNLTSLSILGMSSNDLSGMLPPNAGQHLPMLTKISMFQNNLYGHIPMSLSNSSSLILIELFANRFSGTIPPNLGSLKSLQFVSLGSNQLEAKDADGWNFLSSLTNCTNLNSLQLSSNNLGGMLPTSVVNFSNNFQFLTMGDNYISGEIPAGIGNLVSLTVLDMGPNLLVGSIPSSIVMLQNMHILDLDGNNLSGMIPHALGNLTHLNKLYLDFNKLTGTIPPSLGNCRELNLIILDSNKLTGGIPKEILTLPSLTEGLSLSANSLTGEIPLEVGSLSNVEAIDFRMNKLSGKIPTTLGQCEVLEILYLGGNLLEGSIPLSLISLKGIQLLDFSQNRLTGRIPDFLQDFKYLYYLNLSVNNFEGEVPRFGVFSNASGVSVFGNNKLCGGNPELHLPLCSSEHPRKKKSNSHTLAVIVATASSFLFLVVLICCLVVRRRSHEAKRKPKDSTPVEEHAKISYAQLSRATNGFSTDNLLGVGSFGTVYKGLLDDDDDSLQAVAVKVLNLQLQGAYKSFISECEALRNTRHRNLVKVITICSSVDFRGSDFKAIVSEFMVNGNLDEWLHPKINEQHEQKNLNLMQRLNIAIDVASALDYLHHRGAMPIIHCDLKPSNILLDSGMTAHLSDFGLARFLKRTISRSSHDSTSSIGLRGTIGYVAPEYGVANKVSTLGDVYSYGILLLEMLTAKRPTDDMFKEGLNLRKYVELAFPDQIMHIMDAHLYPNDDRDTTEEAQNFDYAGTMECVASMLEIGLLCSNELPNERMEMTEIISSLCKVRDLFSKSEIQG